MPWASAYASISRRSVESIFTPISERRSDPEPFPLLAAGVFLRRSALCAALLDSPEASGWVLIDPPKGPARGAARRCLRASSQPPRDAAKRRDSALPAAFV